MTLKTHPCTSFHFDQENFKKLDICPGQFVTHRQHLKNPDTFLRPRGRRKYNVPGYFLRPRGRRIHQGYLYISRSLDISGRFPWLIHANIIGGKGYMNLFPGWIIGLNGNQGKECKKWNSRNRCSWLILIDIDLVPWGNSNGRRCIVCDYCTVQYMLTSTKVYRKVLRKYIGIMWKVALGVHPWNLYNACDFSIPWKQQGGTLCFSKRDLCFCLERCLDCSFWPDCVKYVFSARDRKIRSKKRYERDLKET